MDSTFHQALAAHPFDTLLRLEYALHLLDQNRMAEALAQFQLLKQQNPAMALGHLGESHVLVLLGRDEEAAAARDRAEACFDLAFARRVSFPVPASGPEISVPRLRLVNEKAPSAQVQEAVSFADIVGMEELKKLLRVKIVEPFVRPGLFERFGKAAGGGVLLYGPPGCGKTMFAKAIAQECSARFLSVSVTDVLSKWMGESEERLAQFFADARTSRPCVLFFDELDALGFSRAKMHSEHMRAMVNELLTQLDGLGKDNRGVLVLGATNMPWDVDGALRRPGRFSRFIFVPPPDRSAREAMFRRKLEGIPLGKIAFPVLADATAHFSGADIDGVIECAKEEVLSRAFEDSGCAGEIVLTQEALECACREASATTLEWLKTARNLIRLGGAAHGYGDLEKYLRSIDFI